MFASALLFMMMIIGNSFAQCPVRNGNVCCDNECLTCEICNPNDYEYSECCANLILKEENYCEEGNPPPCVLKNVIYSSLKVNQRLNDANDTNTNTNTGDSVPHDTDFKNLVEWAKNLALYQLILFIAGCTIGLLFIFYACCIFGNKKPPIKYTYLETELKLPEK